ncbi:MAG: hypothetical protein A2843_02605 [Candidatus Wildermuthbacteria bacterium RIFCSPHIGHO2_01_FULL_48_27b]|uniref:Uncharacterized protein n=1 Tax=Candidatus Wildermuthbacteria bacterium RIFCSPHIGHO2_01_FULL_48_27b TaxID=1802447 RepID=A0A1G2QWC4_9BACT|nr:MAG: hypothetical protein A2843_02605 [Candidatus Wildermuthbacteria bacterium RIFCSPHIGHO2_01_FULL_48_27b]
MFREMLDRILAEAEAITEAEYILPPAEPLGPNDTILGEMMPEMLRFHTLLERAEVAAKATKDLPYGVDQTKLCEAWNRQQALENLFWLAIREAFPDHRDRNIAVVRVGDRPMVVATPYVIDMRKYEHD